MIIENIQISKLAINDGQIRGLPRNPREWTKSDIMSLAKSLTETPELFDMRPCIVYPYDGKYVILGGNMRYLASKHNGASHVPCIVIPDDTNINKLKEIVIKDNGIFGEWDYDELANKWDDLPLTDWGVPAWETDVKEDEVTPISEKSNELSVKVTFINQELKDSFIMNYSGELIEKYNCKIE